MSTCMTAHARQRASRSLGVSVTASSSRSGHSLASGPDIGGARPAPARGGAGGGFGRLARTPGAPAGPLRRRTQIEVDRP
ncbi:hypothetical protein GCM10011374_28000 [Kocuria dechangensis]|uniref:Uncharacterized protein n=1 Tax=Kocuria dechangensis TaxID=1176249 RepID=A0A917H015_9MICC|nr:hypothetical protein GCM10011374_28000 [Kocuria dechangensis]